MPVEVWTGSDDGLTQRLRQEIENKLKVSSDFVLSSGKRPGTLVITMPTHVAWKQMGTRTRLHYSMEFASADGSPLGKSEGSCWEDDMAACAAQISVVSEKCVGRSGSACRTLSRTCR
jgi:hypothetical protein